MIRALSLVGFSGGFLVVSPSLRQDVAGVWNNALTVIQDHSPYSYVAVSAAAFVLLTVSLYRTLGMLMNDAPRR